MKKYLLLLFLGLAFPFSQAKASYFAGIELTYSCLGGNTYLVTATLYNDCSCGIPGPSNLIVNFACSSNSILNFTATLNQVAGTGQEISDNCSAITTYCNGGSHYGVKEFVYEAQVTMVPCNSWIISRGSCCREPVSTVTYTNGVGWYIKAELNNLDAPCNSSPAFTNKPMIVSFQGQPVNYNHGALDPDGDSLVYSFYSPYETANQSITYSTPYSASNFLLSSSPIYLDSHTGDIHFNATANLMTVTGIKVEEWRNINGIPTHIGTVCRDMQLKVGSTINHLPTLSGIDTANTSTYNPNDSIYSLEIHPGHMLDFSIYGYDADTFNAAISGRPDVFHISWNQGIPAGNFSTFYNGTDSAYAHFTWTPGYADISNNVKCFTATISDEACHYIGKKIFSYCFKVMPPPFNLGTDTTLCINQSLLLDAGAGNYSYLWSTGDTSQTLLVDSNKFSMGMNTIWVERIGYGVITADTIKVFMVACAGIRQYTAENISLYPNPSDGFVYLDFPQSDIKSCEVKIYNFEGKLVFSKLLLNKNGNKHQMLNLSMLSPGTYYLKITTDKTEVSKAFIIQK